MCCCPLSSADLNRISSKLEDPPLLWRCQETLDVTFEGPRLPHGKGPRIHRGSTGFEGKFVTGPNNSFWQSRLCGFYHFHVRPCAFIASICAHVINPMQSHLQYIGDTTSSLCDTSNEADTKPKNMQPNPECPRGVPSDPSAVRRV